MKEEIWRNTPEDGDRMRRRMAEFLVHGRFPLKLVAGYVVRTPARRVRLVRMLEAAGSHGVYVDVRPEWYYGYSAEEELP